MGRPFGDPTSDGARYVAGGVDLGRGITITVHCGRCGHEHEERYPRPRDIVAWLDAVTAVEERLHELTRGCPGPLTCVWQLTRAAPDGETQPVVQRHPTVRAGAQ